jgi:hypothetical protein
LNQRKNKNGAGFSPMLPEGGLEHSRRVFWRISPYYRIADAAEAMTPQNNTSNSIDSIDKFIKIIQNNGL